MAPDSHRTVAMKDSRNVDQAQERPEFNATRLQRWNSLHPHHPQRLPSLRLSTTVTITMSLVQGLESVPAWLGRWALSQ